MDETSREDADDQIDDDNTPSPERTGHLDASHVNFATFVDPTTSGIPEIEQMAKLEPSLFHSDSIPPRCRIVLMPDPSSNGRYLWTFVPRAKGTGVEPIWPHKVIMLGKEILTTEETWDAYKCDPEYECYIPPAPGLPTVSRRHQPPPSKPDSTRAKTPLKRMGSDAADSADASPRKRQKTTVQEASDDSGIEELTRSHYEVRRAKLKRRQEKEERSREHARTASFYMSNMANDLPDLYQNGFGAGVPASSKPSKEKFSMDTDPVQTKRGRQSWEDPTFRSAKRAKLAPSEEEANKEYPRGNVARRGRHAASRRMRGATPPQNKAKERDFWQDVNFSKFKGMKFSLETDSPGTNAEPNVEAEEIQHQRSPTPPKEDASAGDSSARRSPPIFVDSADDDSDLEAKGESDYAMPPTGDAWEGVEDSEDERERRLCESRRKMEELNRLEQQAREEKGRRERQRQQAARMEEARRQQERQRAEKLRQENFEEDLRRAKAEKENRRRGEPSWHQTNAPWSENHRTSGSHRSNGFNFEWFNSYGDNPFGSRGSTFGSYQARPARPAAASSSTNRWTSQNALDRYNKLSETFDAFKSTTTVPVPALDQIPWPVLFKPGHSMEQVNWEAVEQFFAEAEKLMGGRSYGREKWKEFLKTSTRRFHPDRWRARGIIGDKGYGIDVEEKVNHVSKVLTPLYRNAN